MQFLFLILIHKVQIPAVIRSLKGTHTPLYRDPEEILSQYRKALDKDLLSQLERVLHNNNLLKCQGYATIKKRDENRAYSNHSSIAKNMQNAKKTMCKEEKNKCVGIFPYQLERFLPHMYLTPQRLLVKPRQKDRSI